MIKVFLFSFLTNFFYYCLGSLVLHQSKNKEYSLFYKAFVGVVAASFIALLFNFFIPLNKNINSFIFILVILIFFLKLQVNIKKEVRFLVISTLICFFLILFSNVNRPDAGLYHLPYISILNEYQIIFGLNNLHSRFGHISIIQYLSAFNNNYFFQEDGIIIPLASIAAFYYIYFLNEVIKIYKKKIQTDLSSLFSLSVLIYIAFKLMGYDGFGNDTIAHLSLFYLISYILKLKKNKIDIAPIFLISVFSFLNKSTMIIVFIIPIYIFFYKYKLDLKKIFIPKLFFSIIFFLLWLIKNFIISGCGIYPIIVTCTEYLPWLNINSTKIYNTASEAWSKAWPENNDERLTMEVFIKNFNWIAAWSKKHLIYITNIIVPYILALLMLLIFFRISSRNIKDKIVIIKLSEFYWLAFFTCFVGSISFFIKFPLYRYGYSYIVCLIILIFIYFFKKKIYHLNIINISKVIFFLAFIAFVGKQSFRLINNYNLNYINKPWPRIYSFTNNTKIDSEKYYIKENFYYYFSRNGECMYSAPPCTNFKIDEKLIAKEILGYKVLTYK